MPQGGATFILESGQNLNFSENSNGTSCAHDFDHLGEGYNQYQISTVIVDVHKYEICRITDFTAAL